MACKLNKPDIIKLILEKSCSQKTINATNSDNQTPLYWACFNQNWDIAKLLVISGAKKSIAICSNKTESHPACTPLALACKHDKTQIIRLFLRCFDCSDIIDLVDQDGKTPLLHALEHNNLPIIKLLFLNGAEIRDEHLKAAKSTSNETTQALIEKYLELEKKEAEIEETKNSFDSQQKQSLGCETCKKCESSENSENTPKKLTKARERRSFRRYTEKFQQPVSMGSTGRTVANNEIEENAMKKAKENPRAGYVLKTVNMGDPRWPGRDGWFKMEQIIETPEQDDFIIVHYVHKDNSCLFDDFKFKDIY